MNAIERMVQPDEDGLIVSCHRAGKKVDDRPRLLIVTMQSPDLAQTMHCYGSGRKFDTSSGNKIWCNPDLIKADRIANFNARKLQRERREQNGSRNNGMTESTTASLKLLIYFNRAEEKFKTNKVDTRFMSPLSVLLLYRSARLKHVI